MSSLSTLPKGDSAWLLRKAIQRVAQQINTLETNINPAATGGSLNTQVLFNDAGAVKGDPDFTYNKTTDTLTAINGQFTNLNASGNVALGNLTVSGTFTALGGENASAIRAAASDYAAVNFDGATSGIRITSTLTGQNIGTGDFSVWVRFRCPQVSVLVNNPAVVSLGPTATDGSGNNTFRIVLLAGGNLSIRTNDGSGASTNSDVSGFASAYAGQIVDVVVTRTGSTVKCYINGVDTAISGNLNGSNSITSTYLHVGIGTTSGALFSGRIYRAVVFNRALSATDVTELITVGVNPEDQWGTQTAVYTSDFSVDANGFIATRATVDGNIDGISGVDDTLRMTVDGTASNNHQASRLSILGTGSVIGKRYLLSFNYFIPATNAVMNGIRVYHSSTTNPITPILSTTGAWTTISPVEFVSQENRLDWYGASSGAITFNGNSTDVFYLKSVSVVRIGAIVDLDFTVGTGYQAHDRSSNALHGTLFNGVEFTQPKRVAVLYATTTASGNTQLLGSLALPTNAIIEDIICNASGAATVSIGNVSAGTQIVNGASVVSGRQRLTIATPFSTTGNLWVNSSAAVTLQFTILYTIAA